MESRVAASLAPRPRVAASGVKAVIFDWAGTIVDHGSIAPVLAFVEVFAKHGVSIDVVRAVGGVGGVVWVGRSVVAGQPASASPTPSRPHPHPPTSPHPPQPTARGPMGTNKRDHISSILYSPAVSAAWAAAHGGAAPDEASVDALYAAFTPIQVSAAAARAEPIAGAVALVAALRARGVRVGGCSGYNRAIMEAVARGAAARGLALEANTCANAAGSNGRPKPWMAAEVAAALDAWPLSACVKVDDTLPGIAEGLHAGMWTVGVTASGNELGMDAAELAAAEAADPRGFADRLAAAHARFAAAGAHYVLRSVAELMPVLEDIAARIAAGETPLAPGV